MNAHRRCPGGERRSVPVVMSVGREDQPALRREPRHGLPERSATALCRNTVCRSEQGYGGESIFRFVFVGGCYFLAREVTPHSGGLRRVTDRGSTC